MFLLDANIFIEAKNFYYAFDIFSGFWEWLDQRQQNNDIGSVIPIYEELKSGNDELAEWIIRRKDSGWFLSVDDAEAQQAFGVIVNWVMEQDFRDEAKDEFLATADPWLIPKRWLPGPPSLPMKLMSLYPIQISW